MLPGQVSKTALHAVAHHGVPDRAADDAPDHRGSITLAEQQVHHEGRGPTPRPTAGREAEQLTVGESVLGREHRTARREAVSDRDALAALAAPRVQDRATGAGAHPETETVHLVTAAVVGLVRALAHDGSLSSGESLDVWSDPPALAGMIVHPGVRLCRPGHLSGTTGTRPSAGTAHPRRTASRPVPVMDMRHPSTHRSPRMTGQRYARALNRVKPSRAVAHPRPQSLWRTGCAPRGAGLGSSPPRFPVAGPRVTAGRHRRRAPLRCTHRG